MGFWYVLTLLAGGVVGAFGRGVVEDWLGAREHLRKERSDLYSRLLAPYAAALTNPEEAASLLGADYQQNRFTLVLMADDDAVRKHNELLAKASSIADVREDEREEANIRTMRALGELLLTLRRSVGNEGTDLTVADALEGIGIEDAEEVLG